jgi:hypothetical protein
MDLLSFITNRCFCCYFFFVNVDILCNMFSLVLNSLNTLFQHILHVSYHFQDSKMVEMGQTPKMLNIYCNSPPLDSVFNSLPQKLGKIYQRKKK